MTNGNNILCQFCKYEVQENWWGGRIKSVNKFLGSAKTGNWDSQNGFPIDTIFLIQSVCIFFFFFFVGTHYKQRVKHLYKMSE